jgi:NAD(P)-dependent dehydrogenase (short-subunit alcohol dehydrogenase family)
MELGLKDKIVVVTGAGGAIGREICQAQMAHGAKVIGVDIAGLKDMDFPCYHVDLGSRESIEKGCHEILADHGRIDVLVNNAAFYAGIKVGPMEEIPLDEWDSVMNVNVKGLYLMIKGLLDGLKKAKGKVINFSSASVQKGGPYMLHYVASKGAVLAMTWALSTELGRHGIAVNAISPGLVDTASSQGIFPQFQQRLDMFVAGQSIKQPLKAKDIVGAVLYLSSAWSDAVSGQVCLVDRGAIKH